MNKLTRADWLLGEVLADPQRLFVLWAIKTGFCRRVEDFQNAYGPELLVEELIAGLEQDGFLQQAHEGLCLTKAGEEAVSLLPDVETTHVTPASTFNRGGILRLGNAYQQSVQGLLRLHALEMEGKEESEEANVLRDQLEEPWHHLTAEEQKRLHGLSEDLHSLSATQDTVPKEINPQVQKGLAKAREEVDAGNWDKALELLRRWKDHLKPSQLSFQRGCIWQQAGDSATAVLFFEYAYQLQPKSEYGYFYLRELATVDPPSALRKAQEILAADENNEPSLVISAIEVIEHVTHVANNFPVATWLEIIERTLLRLELQPHRSRVYPLALMWGAWCAAKLDRKEVLERYVNRALTIYPYYDSLLVTRGVLRYEEHPEGAIQDFQKAITLGTKYPQPYGFIAHHAFCEQRFQDCIRYADRALQESQPDAVAGLLWEMKAISQAVLDYSSEEVRASFRKALQYLPGHPRIEQNRKVYEDNLAVQQKQSLPWITLSPAEMNASSKEDLPVPPSLAA